MARQTKAIINLKALQSNLSLLRSIAWSDKQAANSDEKEAFFDKRNQKLEKSLKSDNAEHDCRTKVVAIVKADAYGNGAFEVSQFIESEVDMLGVAFLSEALELREKGIEKRILVMQGPHEISDIEQGEQHSITWMLHSQWQLDAMKAFYAKLGAKSSIESASSCWFKFDSGMHRLGFQLQEINSICEHYPELVDEHTALCTHLACADESDPKHAEYQIQDFLNYAQNLDMPLCIANSATNIRFQNARKDYVRLGIAMYGATPFEPDFKHAALEPVMSLHAPVIGLRHIPKGDSVGYGATWRAHRDSVIATVAIGYADGYPRHAPTGTPAFCNKGIIPLVGRVSMDMLTFDVTDSPDIKIGDCVQLWGDKLPINEVAEHIGTIAYELMTRVSKRVPRVYVS